MTAQTQPVLPELATTPEEPAQAVHEAAPACEYVLPAQGRQFASTVIVAAVVTKGVFAAVADVAHLTDSEPTVVTTAVTTQLPLRLALPESPPVVPATTIVEPTLTRRAFAAVTRYETPSAIAALDVPKALGTVMVAEDVTKVPTADVAHLMDAEFSVVTTAVTAQLPLRVPVAPPVVPATMIVWPTITEVACALVTEYKTEPGVIVAAEGEMTGAALGGTVMVAEDVTKVPTADVAHLMDAEPSVVSTAVTAQLPLRVPVVPPVVPATMTVWPRTARAACALVTENVTVPEIAAADAPREKTGAALGSTVIVAALVTKAVVVAVAEVAHLMDSEPTVLTTAVTTQLPLRLALPESPPVVPATTIVEPTLTRRAFAAVTRYETPSAIAALDVPKALGTVMVAEDVTKVPTADVAHLMDAEPSVVSTAVTAQLPLRVPVVPPVVPATMTVWPRTARAACALVTEYVTAPAGVEVIAAADAPREMTGAAVSTVIVAALVTKAVVVAVADVAHLMDSEPTVLTTAVTTQLPLRVPVVPPVVPATTIVEPTLTRRALAAVTLYATTPFAIAALDVPKALGTVMVAEDVTKVPTADVAHLMDAEPSVVTTAVTAQLPLRVPVVPLVVPATMIVWPATTEVACALVTENVTVPEIAAADAPREMTLAALGSTVMVAEDVTKVPTADVAHLMDSEPTVVSTAVTTQLPLRVPVVPPVVPATTIVEPTLTRRALAAVTLYATTPFAIAALDVPKALGTVMVAEDVTKVPTADVAHLMDAEFSVVTTAVTAQLPLRVPVVPPVAPATMMVWPTITEVACALVTENETAPGVIVAAEAPREKAGTAPE